MRKTILILTALIMGSSMVHAMGPSPLGPVSRDLLLAKLTTVQYSMNSLNERHAAERGLATVILSIILLQHDKVVQEGAFACDYAPRGRLREFTCHHGSVRATDKLLKMLKDLDPQLSGTHDVLGDITAVLSSFVDRK